MKIGFFDSGVGGLSVLKEAVKILPNESYIYYADTQHAPYGTKDKEQVKKLIFNAVDFLVTQNIKMLVVACNTATSIAIEDLRRMFAFPIIGMEPAVKPAVQKSMDDGKRVLVLATPLTLKEGKFHNLLQRVDSDHIVDFIPFPELVELAEKLVFDGSIVEELILSRLPMKDIQNYGTVVLGCTHFPLYRKFFRKILPSGIDVLDGGSGTVRYMKKILEEQNCLSINEKKPDIQFFNSGIEVTDKKLLEIYNKILQNDESY